MRERGRGAILHDRGGRRSGERGSGGRCPQPDGEPRRRPLHLAGAEDVRRVGVERDAGVLVRGVRRGGAPLVDRGRWRYSSARRTAPPTVLLTSFACQRTHARSDFSAARRRFFRPGPNFALRTAILVSRPVFLVSRPVFWLPGRPFAWMTVFLASRRLFFV